MTRGDPIPGSKLVRDWCAGCQEPIRVTVDAIQLGRNYCRECAPVRGEQFERGEW